MRENNIEPLQYRAYTQNHLRSLPQLQALGEKHIKEMEVVSHVLPFKANSYVVDRLIDWSDPLDPMFLLTFPQRGMLSEEHFQKMEAAIDGGDKTEIGRVSHEIRMELNPHPAGQMESNVPTLRDGTKLPGIQHKYGRTVLFFPAASQTCHAYCTFCFRWPQFTGMEGLKFAMKESHLLVQYLREHPEVTDVLFTGGDPMVMGVRVFRKYVDALIEAKLPHIKTIRIGSKSLSYWPYKFVNERDTEEFLDCFRRLVDNGFHVAFMGHFNHPRELELEVATEAMKNILSTGAQIRSQTPLLRSINDSPEVFARMWQLQVSAGAMPYYMFVARDTGAQHYFSVPLARAWDIYRKAVSSVSGLGRTVRGPSMSAGPGKVQVLGVSEIHGEKVFVLQFLQGREPEWCHRPFFAKYDPYAEWLDDLQPAFGEQRFFFEPEYSHQEMPPRVENLRMVASL